MEGVESTEEAEMMEGVEEEGESPGMVVLGREGIAKDQ